MVTSEKTNKIILTGVMMAITAAATMVIAIPVPFTSGYIHLGDSMIFLSVLILGWRYGAIAAGVGSALADIFLSYVHWAPWTLCIKGIMAIFMGLMMEKAMGNRRNTAIAIGAIAIFWLAFHFAVNRIIGYEAAHNPADLLSDRVPDAKTIWLYEDIMSKQAAGKDLFGMFFRELTAKGYVAEEGRIVDATFIEAPKRKNTAEQREKAKKGEVPCSAPSLCTNQ